MTNDHDIVLCGIQGPKCIISRLCKVKIMKIRAQLKPFKGRLTWASTNSIPDSNRKFLTTNVCPEQSSFPYSSCIFLDLGIILNIITNAYNQKEHKCFKSCNLSRSMVWCNSLILLRIRNSSHNIIMSYKYIILNWWKFKGSGKKS